MPKDSGERILSINKGYLFIMIVNINEVNELLEQAFGEGTRGNYKRRRCLAFLDLPGEFFDSRGEYVLSDKLHLIMKKSNHYIKIGQFTNSNGSSLKIHDGEKYSGEVERYVRLYEEKFGILPVISFDE